MKSLLILLFLVGLTVTSLGGQPYATLLDRDGERLRGIPIAIGKTDFTSEPVAMALKTSTWEGIRERGLNTVRLCWVDPWFNMEGRSTPAWTMAELTEFLDACVANAEAAGVNVIINYHNVGEYQKTEGFGRMAEFWKAVAPRYADNDRVFYELNNEQAWNKSAYLSRPFRRTMKRVYRRVRRAAPDRQIILFSFNSLRLPMKEIVDHYRWIDWDYTTIGWHFYGEQKGNVAQEEANLMELISAYPSICTEWDYPGKANYVIEYFDGGVVARQLERFGIGWIDWRGWNDATLDETDNLLFPDAERHGYDWRERTSKKPKK